MNVELMSTSFSELKVLKVLVREGQPIKLNKYLAWMRFGGLEAFNSINIVPVVDREKPNF